MDLCECLTWLRQNNATVYMRTDWTEVQPNNHSTRYGARTLEEAVESAVCSHAKAGETVAEAARRGFNS